MTDEQVFYDLIYPYGKKDTIENANKIIQNIKTQKDYETVLMRCVGYTSKVILQKVIDETNLETLKTLVKKDESLRPGQRLETMKERLINASLRKEDEEVFMMVCDMFDVREVVPSYKVLSDIVYMPGRYDDNFINTKTNVNYLTDIEKNMRHFEDVITDMRNVYNAGYDLTLQKQDKDSTYETKDAFKELVQKFGVELNEEEMVQIKQFAIDYYNFIKNEFDGVIEDIKRNETKPDSDTDCWGLLYNYLGRDASKWERDILWDHTCDEWGCDEESD